jgi:hypothetical protein
MWRSIFGGRDLSSSQLSILNNVSFGAKNPSVGKHTNFGQLLMDKEHKESRIGGRSRIFPEIVIAFRVLQPET